MVAPTGKSDVRLRALRLPVSPKQNAAPQDQNPGSGSLGLAPKPLGKVTGAWLNTVRALRGDRTQHTIEIEREPFDLHEAKARSGDDVVRLHELAMDGANCRQKNELSTGETSWAGFYRLAAKGAFGSQFASTIKYAQIQARMKELGLSRELETMLSEMPRDQLIKMRKFGISPLEIFTARATATGSWRASQRPMTMDELRAETTRAELEALTRDDRARIETGVMTGVEIARLITMRQRENVDVLVIGAGAAGTGAANELLDRGLSVTVLEAKSRTGGRAYTEEGALGLAFDHGCAWIHESSRNPLMPMVEALGFNTVGTEKFQKVFAGGDPAQDAPLLHERMEAFGRRWAETARKRPDAPASLLSAPEHRLDPMTAEVLGPLEMALELDQVPVGEFQRGVLEKDDRMVEGGLGNVIHAFAHGLPIELDSPVQKIKWSKDGVEVESNGRIFRAKQIILTVSAGVLEQLEFDPPLPRWKRDAIQSLQMASFEKIALRFAPGALDGVDPFERGCGSDDQGRSFELLVKPWGKDVAVVMVGGDLAKAMVKQPEQEAIDFAIDVMTQHYGDVRAAFEHGERTEWTLDPYVRGTWAVSRVDSKDFDRIGYSAPVDDTIFIAGEACAGDWMTSVNGAFFNGRDVARNVFSIHASRAAI